MVATQCECCCKHFTKVTSNALVLITQHYLLDAENPPVELMANCTLGDVRLVNGTSELEGRVEVCFGNLWGTLCHNSWDNRDAGVICKQLFNPLFGKLCVYLYIFHAPLTFSSHCHL